MSISAPPVIIVITPGVFQMCLGKPGEQVDILLPLLELQTGAPEQDGPQPPKGAVCWGCLTPGPDLPGEQGCVSQLTQFWG